MSPRWALVLSALAMIGLLGASCARPTPTGGLSPSKGDGVTITIGPRDAGKTITLTVGDTLVFAASANGSSPSAMAWLLVSYPKNLITRLQSSSSSPFRFRAVHPGTGVLELSNGPRCGSPGPALGDSMQCPVAGAMSQAADIPTRLVTFRLHVLARGG